MLKKLILTLLLIAGPCCLFVFAQSEESTPASRTQWVDAIDLLPEGSFTDQPEAIRIIDAYHVAFNPDIGKGFWGISGLAWDEQAQRLYAVSDTGELHHLKLTMVDGRLKSVELLETHLLKNAKANVLKWRDSEGLSIRKNAKGQTELLISFERHPRILRYSMKGDYLGKLALPELLQDKKNFRSSNAMFEAVLQHPTWGVLTATELPLKAFKEKEQRLYDMKGNVCEFKASNAKRSSVTAMELMADGRSILILERAWAGLSTPLVITLKKVSFSGDEKMPEKLHELSACQATTLASLSTDQGWEVDNFEGLTHLGKDRYLMVTDDNNNPFQRTLFVYFEVLK